MKRFRTQLCAALISIAFAAALFAQAPGNNGSDKKGEAQRKNDSEKKSEAEKKNGAEKKNAAAPPAEEVDRGKTVYDKRCTICHFAASDAKKVGPGLKGISKRSAYESDGKPVNDASLRAWIENGGKNMPGFKTVLSADQVRDLLSYLKTL